MPALDPPASATTSVTMISRSSRAKLAWSAPPPEVMVTGFTGTKICALTWSSSAPVPLRSVQLTMNPRPGSATMLGSYWSPRDCVLARIGSPPSSASESNACTKTPLPEPSLRGLVLAVQAMAKPPSARLTILGPADATTERPCETVISVPTGSPAGSKIWMWWALPAELPSYHATAILPLARTVTDDSTEFTPVVVVLTTISGPVGAPVESRNLALTSHGSPALGFP